MNIVEKQLEVPVSNALIEEFVEQEAVAKQQVEAARVKLEAFVESIFVLPQTILLPLYLPIFPSFYSTFPIKQPIQGIFVIL
jgi:hypothetical protein